MEEAKSRSKGVAQDDGMREIFLKILDNPALDMRDKKAAIIDFITAGIETVRPLGVTKTMMFQYYISKPKGMFLIS